VISTNATGTKDTVSHEFNGLLIEPKSVEQLAETMTLLYENRELRKRLGQNGIEWAKNFDNLIIWQGMEERYNSVK
jgi:glycosyltransferase involved in cell wall biosynthesis